MLSNTSNLTISTHSASQPPLPITTNITTTNTNITATMSSPLSVFRKTPVSAIKIKPTSDSEALKSSLVLDDGTAYDDIEQTEENIILDMDGFLLDNIPLRRGFTENPSNQTFPVPRPYLGNFLRFVFKKYRRVSIWTAATSVWFDVCYEHTIKPNMPAGASFDFVRTHPDGTPRVPVKPLSTIFREHPEYTAANTTIGDDNPETFRDNIANAEQLPHYFYDLLGFTPTQRRIKAAQDDELLKLIERLKVRKPGNTGAVDAAEQRAIAILSALTSICNQEEDDDEDIYA